MYKIDGGLEEKWKSRIGVRTDTSSLNCIYSEHPTASFGNDGTGNNQFKLLRLPQQQYAQFK